MPLPRGLVAGQGLTWIGPQDPDEVVSPGDRGVFIDYDGDPEGYVVRFHDTAFCCDASDVRPDPRHPVRVERRHTSK